MTYGLRDWEATTLKQIADHLRRTACHQPENAETLNRAANILTVYHEATDEEMRNLVDQEIALEEKRLHVVSEQVTLAHRREVEEINRSKGMSGHTGGFLPTPWKWTPEQRAADARFRKCVAEQKKRDR